MADMEEAISIKNMTAHHAESIVHGSKLLQLQLGYQDLEDGIKKWPAAFTWLFVTLFLTLFFNHSGAFGYFKNNLADTVAALLQVANLHYLHCIYYKSGICGGVDGIYWSLSLEEQFYLLFPFLMFFISNRRSLLVFLMIIVLVQLPLSRGAVNWDPMWAIRTDALALGVIIALLQKNKVFSYLEPTFLQFKMKSLICFGMGIFFLATVPSDMSIVSFYTGLLAIVCAILVFVGSFNKGYIFPEGIVKRVLVYIGSRSYALYLVHNPMYFLTREILFRAMPGVVFGGKHTFISLVLAIPLSFIFAELTYRFIETPLRLRGRVLAKNYYNNIEIKQLQSPVIEKSNEISLQQQPINWR